ncbi:MAG: phosphate uptake regulator PhoU [Candidatus Bathyarchaeia archaeon]
MEQRRIISLGRSSLVISLPKYWIQSSGLKAGDVVSVAVGRDRSLVIYPGLRKENEEKSITLYVEPDEKHSFISRKIIACYLNGYSNIKLISKNFFTATQQKIIQRTAQALYMRIMDADAKEVSMATFLDESKGSVEMGISRMHRVSSSMCRDAFTSLKEQNSDLARSVYSLDDEVDRFSFFLLRLIRKAAMDPALANDLGLDVIDCLDYQTLIHRIEQIADQAANVAKHVIMLKGRKKSISDVLREKICNVGYEAVSLFDRAVNALLSNEVRELNDIIESNTIIEKLNEEIAILSFTEERSAEAVCACCALRDSILRIAEYSADIAEIAINRSYKPQ